MSGHGLDSRPQRHSFHLERLGSKYTKKRSAMIWDLLSARSPHDVGRKGLRGNVALVKFNRGGFNGFRGFGSLCDAGSDQG